jgi:hypothetical protein
MAMHCTSPIVSVGAIAQWFVYLPGADEGVRSVICSGNRWMPLQKRLKQLEK